MSQPAAADDAQPEKSVATPDARLEPEESGPPTVQKTAWIRDTNDVRQTTYMIATGHRLKAAPPSRPLPSPTRFRNSSRMRSGLTLLLVLALIVLIPIGVIIAQHEAEAHITIPSLIPGIPGLSKPTPTHTPKTTPTVVPTHTPAKKK